MEGLLFPLQGDPSELMCVLVWKLPPRSPELSSAPRAAQSILPSQVNAVSSSIKGKPRGNGDKCGFGWSEQQVPVTQLPKQSNTGCCAWRALLEPGVCMGPVSTPDPQESGFGNSLQNLPELGNAVVQQQWEQQGGTQDPPHQAEMEWGESPAKTRRILAPCAHRALCVPRTKPAVSECNQSEEGSSCLWQRTLQGRERTGMMYERQERSPLLPSSNEFFPLA